MSSSPCVTPPVRRPRPGLTDLGPVAQLRAGRLGRRLPQLYAGLVLYGVSLAMMVRGDLGLAPWDVLHSGLAGMLPLTLGQVLILVSLLVLLLWIPLREVPGLGTISNAVVVGVAADAALAVLTVPDALSLRVVLMLGGVALNAVAIGPLAQLVLPWVTVELRDVPAPDTVR
jgi:uncharacterized membrane protein YczE